jgi:hypothetical protein
MPAKERRHIGARLMQQLGAIPVQDSAPKRLQERRE